MAVARARLVGVLVGFGLLAGSQVVTAGPGVAAPVPVAEPAGSNSGPVPGALESWPAAVVSDGAVPEPVVSVPPSPSTGFSVVDALERFGSGGKRTTPVDVADEIADLDLGIGPSDGGRVPVGRQNVVVLVGQRGRPYATSKAQVQMIGTATAASFGLGVLGFRLLDTDPGRPAAVGGRTATIEVDYSQFADAHGGDFEGRLQMMRYPACVLDTPELKECSTGVPVGSAAKDVEARRFVVDVRFDDPDDRGRPDSVGSSGGAAGGAGRSLRASGSGGSLYALGAGYSSNLGSFNATPLSASMGWDVGLRMGSFAWSYPVPVPPTGYGAAPQVSLSYNSSVVDGMVSDENTQGGLLGPGWGLNAGGYIERTYKTCAQDGGSSSDFCWFSDNASIVLNGKSSELIFTGVGSLAGWSEWRLKDDPGWKVVRQRGYDTSDDNLGERWFVYSPDGTEYQFGVRAVPGTGEALGSMWNVPVFGGTGEPCAGTWCYQAWRWNLDRVRDRFGNVTLYKYVREANMYGVGGAPNAPGWYTRGGYLAEIRYGIREGSEWDYKNIVRFNMMNRCLSAGAGGCLWYSAGNTTPWYIDTPTDLRCSWAPCWKYAPGFWTEFGLQSIDTYSLTTDPNNGVNRLQNGEFDNGIANWSVLHPAGGSTFWQTAADANNAVTETGNFFAVSTSVAGGSVYQDGTIPGSLPAGWPMDFTVWMRTPAGTTASVSQVLWRLNGTPQAGSANFTVDDTWRPYTVTLTPTAATSVVRAQVYLNTAGVSVYLDRAAVNQRWQIVDRINLTMEWPDPDGGGVIKPLLWLRTISRTGGPFGPVPVTTPDVRFESSQVLDNRADAIWMPFYRITEVNTETGGRIAPLYGQPNPCVAMPPAPDWSLNTQNCFPRWTVYDSSVGWGTFARYPVSTVTLKDLVAGGPDVVSTYTYAGGEAYRYDDSPFTANKTWSRPAGYGNVSVNTGPTANGSYTRVNHKFFRGLHADPLGAGGNKSVQITYPSGQVVDDWWWYTGREYVTEQFNVTTVVERSETFYNPVATVPSNGAIRLDTVRALRSSLESGGGYLRTEQQTIVDSYGLPVTVWDRGDLSTTVDDTCTSQEYVRTATVTNVWLLNVATRTVQAPGGPTFPGGAGVCNDEATASVLGQTTNLYDGLAFGQATVIGALTSTQVMPTPATTETTTYTRTAWGAVQSVDGPRIDVTDVTTYGYNLSLGLVNSVTDPTGHTIVTEYDPGRGTPRILTDQNNRTVPSVSDGTDRITYELCDALGRLVSVQLPGDPNPTLRYSYNLTKTAVSSVVSKTRITESPAVWTTQATYIDGLSRTRETQTQSPAGTGRLISGTIYDGRGQPARVSARPWYDGLVPGAGFTTLAGLPTSLASETRYSYDDLGRTTLTALYSAGVQVTAPSTINPATNVAVETVTNYDGHWTNTFGPGVSPTSVHTNVMGLVDTASEYNTTWVGAKNTTRTYDLNRNVATITDPKLNVTSYQTDNAGRQTGSTDRDHGTTTYTYRPGGAPLTTTTPTATLWFGVDVLGRATQIRNGSSAGTLLEQYDYDPAGQAGMLAASHSYNAGADLKIEQTGFDLRGRPTGQTYTIPSVSGVTDTNGLAGTYAFTAMTYRRDDQLVSYQAPVLGALPAETVTTGYGATGAPTTLSNGASLVSATTFHNDGLLKSRIYPGSSGDVVRDFTWKQDTGRLDNLKATRTGTILQSDIHSYDAVGNLTRVVHDRAGTTSDHSECYGFDGRNRLTNAKTVNLAGACTGTVGGIGQYNQTFTIDEIANMTSGPLGTYTYPTSGATSTRPHAVTTAGPRTYTYNNNGTTNTLVAAGVTSTYTWDNFERLTQLVTGATTTKMWYFAGGQRGILQDTGGTHIYLAGLAERHTTSSGGGGGTVYTQGFETSTDGWVQWYNPSTLTTSTDTTRTGTNSLKMVAASGQSTGKKQVPGTVGTPYTTTAYVKTSTGSVWGQMAFLDAAGTQIGSATNFAYLTANNTWQTLTATATAPAGTATIEIRFEAGGTTAYIDDVTITSSSGSGSVATEKRYYNLGSTTVAIKTKTGATTTTEYLYTDARGSVTLTTQPDTTTTTEQWYTPYGTPRSTNTITATTRGYINQHHDPTGLIYLNNRYLDPALGRFVSVDPLVSLTGSAYSYGNNNPTSFSDPGGLAASRDPDCTGDRDCNGMAPGGRGLSSERSTPSI